MAVHGIRSEWFELRAPDGWIPVPGGAGGELASPDERERLLVAPSNPPTAEPLVDAGLALSLDDRALGAIGTVDPSDASWTWHGHALIVDQIGVVRGDLTMFFARRVHRWSDRTVLSRYSCVLPRIDRPPGSAGAMPTPAEIRAVLAMVQPNGFPSASLGDRWRAWRSGERPGVDELANLAMAAADRGDRSDAARRGRSLATLVPSQEIFALFTAENLMSTEPEESMRFCERAMRDRGPVGERAEALHILIETRASSRR